MTSLNFPVPNFSVKISEALRYKPEGRGFDSLMSLIQSFRPHYGPGLDSASNSDECQEYFLGGKGGRCVGLTTLPPSCADCREIWDPQTPGTLRACPGLLAVWAADKVAMLTCQPITNCCSLCSDALWFETCMFSLRTALSPT